MKQGKVSEVVLKRSVFKNLHKHRKEVEKGPGVGGDGSITCISGNKIVMTTSGVVDYTDNDQEYYTFYKCFNNMMAMGAKPVSVSLNIILPPKGKEKELKEIVKRYDYLCGIHNIQIAGGHTQFSKQVNNVITNIIMIGEADEFCGIMDKKKTKVTGASIVMTKAMGIEGTAIIAKDKESLLRERFNGRFCDQCLDFKKYISVEKEADIAKKYSPLMMHDVSGAGVFGAIWEVATSFDMGAEIDLRAIPVWQETIEVTELFDINPYKMASQGSLLIVTYEEEALIEELEANGIGAAVIGKLVEGNDKVLMNNDEKRFLEPPRGDDIYLVTTNKGE